MDCAFDGSQALHTQIEQGASPDIFVSANVKQMKALEAGGFMENDTVSVFLENSLTVIVPATNPANITSLADLTRPDVKLVIGTKDVPFGSYSQQVLDTMADPAYGTAYLPMGAAGRSFVPERGRDNTGNGLPLLGVGRWRLRRETLHTRAGLHTCWRRGKLYNVHPRSHRGVDHWYRG